MKKVTKIILILFICLLNILILSFLDGYPIYISLTTATFFQIPIHFWIILIIFPFYLYGIAKTSRNKLVIIICAMFYFFIFYSYGLYFTSHPTFTDIGSTTEGLEFFTSITHIGESEIRNVAYLNFPVFFVFSKIFSNILGIAPVLTINLGFMSMITIFPIFLTFFYENQGSYKNIEKYFIIPALFLTLSYYFLNDQFVPQFIAFVYLVIVFGCYIKYKETENQLFLIFIFIFYFLTVFSHAFIFLFFLIAIIFEKIWTEYIEKEYKNIISYEMLIMLFLLPSINITVYIEELRKATIFGGSGRILGYIFSNADNGFQELPLYNLVPELYDQLLTFIGKGLVTSAFIIVSIGFLFYLLKKKGIFAFGIIAGSFLWFIMGFFRLVLGERALQITPLALSRHFKNSHKIFSYLSKIIIVIILISPFLTVCNTVINESISGERLVQDNEENVAGKFLDMHLKDEEYYILAAQNAYPTGINFEEEKLPTSISLSNYTIRNYLDFVIDSPKLKFRNIYYNITFPSSYQDYIVYNSRNVNIISIWK